MQMISEFAPAKINLSLHLVGQKSDGYHLLDSIVSFVNIGDKISIEPGKSGKLKVAGPFAKVDPLQRDQQPLNRQTFPVLCLYYHQH